jgi:hypothetical protein
MQEGLRQIADTEERLTLLRMRLDQLYRGRRKMITISKSAPPAGSAPPRRRRRL